MQNPDFKSAPDRETAYLRRIAALNNRFKLGANWFYFIAAFSLIILFSFSTTQVLALILGLGMTQIVVGYANNLIQAATSINTLLIKIAAVIISLAIAAGFVVIGYFSHKRRRIAFIAGIAIYSLDGLLLLILGQVTAFAFHLFGLYGIWRGLDAFAKLDALEKAGPPIPEITV